MLTKNDVTIGQTIIVSRQRQQPYRLIVGKVGRVWIHASRDGTVDGTRVVERFRLDDQTDGSHYGWRGRFYTLDQWTERQRYEAACRELREQGITIDYDSAAWRGREIELAALLRTATTNATTDKETRS